MVLLDVPFERRDERARAATTIAASARGRSTRQQLGASSQPLSATVIAAHARGAMARHDFRRARTAETEIARYARGCACRRDFQKKRGAAVTIQNAQRQRRRMHEAAAERRELNRARSALAAHETDALTVVSKFIRALQEGDPAAILPSLVTDDLACVVDLPHAKCSTRGVAAFLAQPLLSKPTKVRRTHV